MAYKSESKIKNNFTKITISLASPEDIQADSRGEVLKPETINYRTYKPERDGLFCERIFGPVKDYECNCGKYKRIRYRGTVCDRCGVEVTEKKVRRERMGHIQLVVPVAHVWYFRSTPNKIGYLLGIPSKKLEGIIYYEKYVVVQPGIMPGVETYDLLTEEEYNQKMEELEALDPENQSLPNDDPNKFIALMGAEGLYELLVRLDVDELSYELRNRAQSETSQQRKNDALKRLQVVEAFRASKNINRPEWMILKNIPVIPPDLRPLVPLDGGRFASSDLNDLYRRVIIRNNRLKKLLEVKAPGVIVRNEKRMLQEAVDSLFDNSRKSSAVKSDNNRPLKSLSDSLKGKQGRFRQNLLGKRVDYSARSVIVVGPNLKMHECGLPKHMAAELYKPFVIRKLLERGIVKTVKSAKKIVDRREPVVWDILENVMKGHPVLLNRAPTLHRLGIQAFQPKMIEGKAIQLHPLSCTAFNADFDGDQMAVHLPLSNAAVLEAQMLMLASHNILNPANGAPITVPSQDMVLGLYYITKIREGAKGEGFTFYGPDEATIAYNEGRLDIHAKIKVWVHNVKDPDGMVAPGFVENTSMGRLMVNEFVPTEVGYQNEVMTKKSLRKVIGEVIRQCGVAATAKFLDDIKDLGYYMAFKGGLSFNLDDVIVPEKKEEIIAKGRDAVEEIEANYAEGNITSNERYNQIIDEWGHTNVLLTNEVLRVLASDDDGFNSVFMMMDSGARGSKDQIRQLAGMRGLMAKPKKSGADSTGSIIENPIMHNFKEGLSVQEYFISTHGARKGLADTALKTADAGYLTRRLVDVSHDVVINEEDCGTLRGIVATELLKQDEVIASLYSRILGRVSVYDVHDPATGELIVAAGEEIREEQAEKIEAANIESVEIRSVLTCESKNGVCAKCYGRNLATNRMVHKGEVVGVIAAQSIGEPGTQLTLRTFHVGGVASTTAVEAKMDSKHDGIVKYKDLITVQPTQGENYQVAINRQGEIQVLDRETHLTLAQYPVPYGSKVYIADGGEVDNKQTIFEWDALNAVLVSDVQGFVRFKDLEENVNYRIEIDAATGLSEMIVKESRNVKSNPILEVIDDHGEVLRQYNLPVGFHIGKMDGAPIAIGEVYAKSPRVQAGSSDITGGLPRVTELFEARNPSNPAVVAEIDGEVSFGKIKRGSREVIITSKLGDVRKYLVPISKQLLVQDRDYIRAGQPLSEGAITPADILSILGPTAVQEYIVNEVQDVYRLQGVQINDKHFEVIVRQMMRKVEIVDPGDTLFLEAQIVDKVDVLEENNRIWGKKVVTDAGDSEVLKAGQIVTARKLRDENSALKRKDLKLVEARDANPATSMQILQGITRAALQTKSFMSAASFQETTKVLNEAAISAKTDYLLGLKENVICGHLIPAGTGLREYQKMVVMPMSEYEMIQEKNRETGLDPEYAATIEAKSDAE